MTKLNEKNIGIMGWLILGIYFLFASAKGLFYQHTFYFFLILLLLFLLFNINRKRYFIYNSKFMMLFCGQAFLSFISFFTGIQKEESVHGFFKDLFPMIIMLLIMNQGFEKEKGAICINKNKTSGSAIDGVQDKREMEEYYYFSVKLLWTLYASGIFIAAVNFIIFFSSRIEMGERFEWVIPYANTLALFLFMASLAGLSIMQLCNFSGKGKAFMLSGMLLITTALINTYSRTVWLISVMIYLIYFLIIKKENIIKVLQSALKGRTKSKLSVKIFLTKEWLSVGFFSMFVIIYTLRYGVISDRIRSISFNAPELQTRFAYYRDSIRILQDFLFVGTGKGGWSSIQYMYQTSLYSTKYVHSAYIQQALDYGIIGFSLSILKAYIFFRYLRVFYCKSIGKKRLIIVGTFFLCCNLAILLHSCIDIDFEFPVITAWYWTNICLLTSMIGYKSTYKLGMNRKVILSTICAAIIVALTPFLLSELYYLGAQKAYVENNYYAAINKLNYAIKFSPVPVKAYFLKAEALNQKYIQKKDKGLCAISLRYYNKAEQMDKYNPKYHARKGNLLFKENEYKQAADEYKKLIKAQPLVIDYYEAAATTLFLKGKAEYNNGNKQVALADINEIIRIEEMIGIQKKRIFTDACKLKHNKDIMEVTSALLDIFQKAKELQVIWRK